MIPAKKKDGRSNHEIDLLLASERNVLGAMLLHSDAVTDVRFLRATDFYLPPHQLIYSAIVEAQASRAATDPLVVGEVLQSRGRLAEAGGHQQLLDLMESVVTAAGVALHAEIVQEHARRREIANVARELAQRAEEGSHVGDAFAAALQRLYAIEASSRGPHRRSACSPRDVLDTWQRHGPLAHQPTGIATLDKLTGGGLARGTRCYIVGAPDAGKTALLVQLADTYITQGLIVGILAVDAEPGDVLERFLQRRGWPRWQCERREAGDMAAMRQQVEELGLLMFDNTWNIEAAAKELASVAHQLGRSAMLGVDSVQTVHCALEEQTGSRYEAVTARVQALRAVADLYRLIVVATSEMSRSAYRSSDPRNQLNDLASAKESGAIEYSARVLLALRSVEGESDVVELRIAKNKHGPSHRHNEPGIHLRLNRDRQVLTEATDFVRSTANVSEEKVEKAERQGLDDAATLARILAKQQGMKATRLEERATATTKGGMGDRRFRRARGILGEAIVEVPGTRNSKLLYLDGSTVPTKALERVPLADRLMCATGNMGNTFDRAHG
jgi:replicative DNA helicase